MNRHFLYFAVLLLSGCVLNPNSNFVTDQVVSIVPINKEGGRQERVIIPDGISWSFEDMPIIKSYKSKPYARSYTKMFNGEDFYEIDSDPDQVHLRYRGFSLKRYSKEDLVSELSFEFEVSPDGTMLRLRPISLLIEKSKIRLRKKDQNLDLNVMIGINAYWIDRRQVIRKNKVTKMSFELRGLELGKPYTGGPGGNLVELAGTHRYKQGEVASDWFSAIPISRKVDGSYIANTYGNFSIEIEVTEVDDFGKRMEKIGKNVQKLADVVK